MRKGSGLQCLSAVPGSLGCSTMPGVWTGQNHPLPERIPGISGRWLPGTLAAWNAERGFGFIKPLGEKWWDRTRDLYCHCRQLSGSGRGGLMAEDIKQGEKVLYEPGWDVERDRQMAVQWRAIRSDEEHPDGAGDRNAQESINQWNAAKQEEIKNAQRMAPFAQANAAATKAIETLLHINALQQARLQAVASFLMTQTSWNGSGTPGFDAPGAAKSTSTGSNDAASSSAAKLPLEGLGMPGLPQFPNGLAAESIAMKAKLATMMKQAETGGKSIMDQVNNPDSAGAKRDAQSMMGLQDSQGDATKKPKLASIVQDESESATNAVVNSTLNMRQQELARMRAKLASRLGGAQPSAP
mmetsp:Transcript_48020/g.89923  ORF Transcript_48020/g.89923 Transcript_48020/m.89923 type:complete len:355 (+) Transcript_48020:18-1082(+)